MLIRRWDRDMHRQGGFTVVELMIATIVFSTIMLVASATVIRFTNNFQRGLTQTTTQNTARSVIDTVSELLQTSGASGYAALADTGASKGICIGDDGTRFSYIPAQRPLIREDGLGPNCQSGDGSPAALDVAGNPSVGTQLIGENMRIMQLSVEPIDGERLYTVSVMVVYGDDDLLCSTAIAGSCDADTRSVTLSSLNEEQVNGLRCKTKSGSQYCAVSSLSTTVKRKL